MNFGTYCTSAILSSSNVFEKIGPPTPVLLANGYYMPNAKARRAFIGRC